MRKVKVSPFLTSVLMSIVLVLSSFVSLVHASEYPDPTTGNTDFANGLSISQNILEIS